MKTYPLEDTLRMLGSAGSIRKVSRATGLNERWLYMLLEGRIRDPGVMRVRRLHQYLLNEGAEDAESAA